MLRDALLQLHRDLKSQKLRTLLTVFGLVWGTVAVTLLLAFGAGLKKQLIKPTAGLGDRICISWPGLTSIPYQGLGKGRRIRITDEDLEAVRPRVDGLKRMSSEYSDGWKMVYNLKTYPVDVSGVSPEFGRDAEPDPGAGRPLPEPARHEAPAPGRLPRQQGRRGRLRQGDRPGGEDRPLQRLAVPRRRRPDGQAAGLELQQPRQRPGLDPRDDVPGADGEEVPLELRLPARLGARVEGRDREPARRALAPARSSTRRTRKPSRSGTRPSSSSSSRSSCSPSRSSSASSAR